MTSLLTKRFGTLDSAVPTWSAEGSSSALRRGSSKASSFFKRRDALIANSAAHLDRRAELRCVRRVGWAEHEVECHDAVRRSNLGHSRQVVPSGHDLGFRGDEVAVCPDGKDILVDSGYSLVKGLERIVEGLIGVGASGSLGFVQLGCCGLRFSRLGCCGSSCFGSFRGTARSVVNGGVLIGGICVGGIFVIFFNRLLAFGDALGVGSLCEGGFTSRNGHGEDADDGDGSYQG